MKTCIRVVKSLWWKPFQLCIISSLCSTSKFKLWLVSVNFHLLFFFLKIAYLTTLTRTHMETHTSSALRERKPQSKQVNIRSTWQQWGVMRCCSGNKVFVGTLKHSHITSLLILGDQALVGMATGTWLKPEARPESQCRKGNTQKHTCAHTQQCSGEMKKFRSSLGDHRLEPPKWENLLCQN